MGATLLLHSYLVLVFTLGALGSSACEKEGSEEDMDSATMMIDDTSWHSVSLLSLGHAMHKVVTERHAVKSQTHVSSGIDFVYCWSGEAMQRIVSNSSDVNMDNAADTETHSGYGFNELRLSIRSLQVYAPWFNKIYLLVNGPARVPPWAANDPRIVMVDRCTLFPRESDCPTFNTHACQAVVHRIPGLAERFVSMEDDMFFVEPVTPATFFSADDKPLVRFIYHHTVQLYPERPPGPDMPPEHVPMRLCGDWYPHKPIPMHLNFSWFLEREFGDWFAYVRSHKHRFQCCDPSKNDSATVELSWEEDFLRIYPAMLHEYNASVERDQFSFHCQNGDCNTPSCVKSCLAHPGLIDMNWQADPDVDGINWPKTWLEVRHLLTEHMDAYQASTANASIVGSSGSTTID